MKGTLEFDYLIIYFKNINYKFITKHNFLYFFYNFRLIVFILSEAKILINFFKYKIPNNKISIFNDIFIKIFLKL